MKCTTTSIVKADREEVMHVRGKRMLYPPGTHDFETIQPEYP
jgi:hypothetical protein